MQELLEYSRRNTAVQGGKLGHPSDFPSFDRRIWHDAKVSHDVSCISSKRLYVG